MHQRGDREGKEGRSQFFIETQAVIKECE